MKPVTDDVVFSILEGLEKREKRIRAKNDAAKIALPAKIFGSIDKAKTIRFERAKERAPKTVNGMFCFVASRTADLR